MDKKDRAPGVARVLLTAEVLAWVRRREPDCKPREMAAELCRRWLMALARGDFPLGRDGILPASDLSDDERHALQVLLIDRGRREAQSMRDEREQEQLAEVSDEALLKAVAARNLIPRTAGDALVAPAAFAADASVPLGDGAPEAEEDALDALDDASAAAPRGARRTPCRGSSRGR